MLKHAKTCSVPCKILEQSILFWKINWKIVTNKYNNCFFLLEIWIIFKLKKSIEQLGVGIFEKHFEKGGKLFESILPVLFPQCLNLIFPTKCFTVMKSFFIDFFPRFWAKVVNKWSQLVWLIQELSEWGVWFFCCGYIRYT